MIVDICELSKLSQLPASTIRYYEEQGLIRSVGRRGLRRTFEKSMVARLSLIALGRHAGLALQEIAEMLGDDSGPAVDRSKLVAKADDLDRQIRKLEALRDALRRTAACPEHNHSDCPTFQRYLKLAVAAHPPKRDIQRNLSGLPAK